MVFITYLKSYFNSKFLEIIFFFLSYFQMSWQWKVFGLVSDWVQIHRGEIMSSREVREFSVCCEILPFFTVASGCYLDLFEPFLCCLACINNSLCVIFWHNFLRIGVNPHVSLYGMGILSATWPLGITSLVSLPTSLLPLALKYQRWMVTLSK